MNRFFVWEDNGGFIGTNQENYNCRIINANKLFDFSNFKTREQITDYLKKYFGYKREQMVFVDNIGTDKYMDGFNMRNARYNQYDIIDNEINMLIAAGIYYENSFYVDRLDSEEKHCFVVKSHRQPGSIVFYSISEFKAWINE